VLHAEPPGGIAERSLAGYGQEYSHVIPLHPASPVMCIFAKRVSKFLEFPKPLSGATILASENWPPGTREPN